MTGTLREAHLNELREQQDSDQSNLSAFSETSKHTATRIAVVREPNETGILEVCDEFVPELGMPHRVLDDFRMLRAQLNGRSSVEDHNRAYDECSLDRRYLQYLQRDSAQEAVQEIVDRLQSGEDITLVCFEGEKKQCHRHVLKEYIEGRL